MFVASVFNRLLRLPLAALLFVLASSAFAQQGNIDINTPAIAAIKNSMQARNSELAPLYASGALGLGANGDVVLRDANAIPLPKRGQANSLVAAENKDRAALYRELARANGHPEWEGDMRKTFAKRWIELAPAGWWVESGGWKQK